MGSVLQFAAFLAICWLFQGAVTHANQHEDKVLNSKHSNRNGPGAEDFYFDEQKANDDNMKTGRAISQSAWSKEDNEQTQKVENKTGDQFNYEFSFKNALSYFFDMIQELKKDILGLKEMTFLKNTKDSTNSRDNSKDNVKLNKKGKNSDAPKPDTSTKNNEENNNSKENQKPKSNYITDYYQKNDITFVDNELEISSDESDDSSHKLNEEYSTHEVNKNEDDRCIFECSESERKHVKYSSGAEETTVIPISHTKIPEESDKEFDGTRDGEKGDNLKETTRKPSKMKQSNLKTTREETENTPISKMGTCMKKNDNSHNLNEKNKQTTKPLRSAEYITRNPQNENSNEAKSERPNQNKSKDNFSKMTSTSPDSRNSGKKSKNEGGLDFDIKSGILGDSTTLSSQSSKDVIYPENIGKEQDASGISSKKPIYKEQQGQTTYLKPGDQEQAQNKTKSLKNNDRSNEYSTVSLKPRVVGSEIPNNEMSTDSEIKSSSKEPKDKILDVSSSHTTVPFTENQPNSKKSGQQSSDSFGTGTTISPANSGNMNADNLYKDPSGNLNGKKGGNGNKNSAANQQGKDYSEIQRNNESKQPQQLNDGDSEPEKTSKNNELNDSNSENNNKEKDDNLTTMATNDISPPENSNREIQNHDAVESENLQEQENNENLKKRNGMLETSPDQEYDFEEENEDFDISDELTDTEMDEDDNQNEEGEIITNNENEMDDDEIDSGNIATVSRNESQISRHTGYVVEEKPQEQYNTFLEYFYKNSNNPLFEALKNQSNNFSRNEIN